MKYLVLAIAILAACEDDAVDTAEVKATKLECKALFRHIVSISPQSQGQEPDKVAGALPSEDIAGCVAAEPEMRACMLAAKDVAGVKACIPSDEVLACMHVAAGAKKAAHEKADTDKTPVDPALDAKFDGIRAKCWAGDGKAADALKTI
ncbi:MAG: hypothetical protein JWO36_7405 [Myxococcales bacterium]|nr:hypothetical protein [Myxococcales bacterium]